VLRISNIEKRFGGLEVLKGISFDVPRGAITGLIGPNGSGKSTLFDVISGYQKPNAGSVELNGIPLVGRMPHLIARAGLVRTFQLTRVFPNLTVAENLLVFAEAGHRRTPSATQIRALELLEFVHLLGLSDREASTLSYGQLKLLEFAQVLMHKPAVLLLDEPFAGINPGLIEQMVEHLRELRSQGMSILLVEHNLPIVSQLCDSVAVVRAGTIMMHDSPDVVVADPRVKEVFLGD
jgi:branched-chain amino acid transport system ATP-binding protein